MLRNIYVGADSYPTFKNAQRSPGKEYISALWSVFHDVHFSEVLQKDSRVCFIIFEAKEWTTFKKKKTTTTTTIVMWKKNYGEIRTVIVVRYDMFVSRQGWAQWCHARWRRIQEGGVSAQFSRKDFLWLGSPLEAETLVRILYYINFLLKKGQKECFSGPYFSFNWLVDINLF